MPINLDTGSLLASVLWGGVGSGYFIYGLKQKRAPALWGGVAMMGITYFIASAWLMTVIAIGLMVGIYYWSQRSD
jgi:hypothetical protein